jgi:hypothetical protein
MLMTAETPITPASGLRGITLFSRQKLVNAPEFFSSSTSSHFYQYLTGWVSVDFIDDLDDDVISTNRQSLDWEHPNGLAASELHGLGEDGREVDVPLLAGLTLNELDLGGVAHGKPP